MYAIIVDGSRQYKVQEGQELEIDLREKEGGEALSPGETVEFGQVLAFRDESGLKLGSPTLDGVKVRAEVLSATRGKKLVIQKFRRRKNSRRRTGHRQWYLKVRVKEISA